MNIPRLKKLQTLLDHPLLVKKKENLLYLTGRSFMNGYLLVKKGDVAFFGDGLEKVEGIKKIDRLKNVGKYLGRGSILEIEDEFTFVEYRYIKHKTRDLKLRAVKSPIDFLRIIKEPQELKNIAIAMRIVQRVFEQVKRELKRKVWTEAGLASYIKNQGLKFGVEDVSFSPIVACGANAAIPHHKPSQKKLLVGESIIIDIGFRIKGYCSDFTRTVFLKRVPERLAKAYNQVEKAYLGAIEAARPGVKAKRLYNLVVQVLAEKKLDKYFIHNLGHGTGLEIHELPNLSPDSHDILQKNMVFSIEPGVYIPSLGGIRIEDLIHLKTKGATKLINTSTQLKDNVI